MGPILSAFCSFGSLPDMCCAVLSLSATWPDRTAAAGPPRDRNLHPACLVACAGPAFIGEVPTVGPSRDSDPVLLASRVLVANCAVPVGPIQLAWTSFRSQDWVRVSLTPAHHIIVHGLLIYPSQSIRSGPITTVVAAFVSWVRFSGIAVVRRGGLQRRFPTLIILANIHAKTLTAGTVAKHPLNRQGQIMGFNQSLMSCAQHIALALLSGY